MNTPRFRLYPTIAFTGVTDIITITQKTSLTALLSSFHQQSITFQKISTIAEIAIGTDYNFPLEYGDLYIMAKIGYNLEASMGWQADGQRLADTDPNWFSRRGIFFQIGVGFGTERH